MGGAPPHCALSTLLAGFTLTVDLKGGVLKGADLVEPAFKDDLVLRAEQEAGGTRTVESATLGDPMVDFFVNRAYSYRSDGSITSPAEWFHLEQTSQTITCPVGVCLLAASRKMPTRGKSGHVH